MAIFIRVDLPAPFSPMTPWTVPGRTFSRTPRSACTPGKRLWMPSSSRMNSLTAPLAPGDRTGPGRRPAPPVPLLQVLLVVVGGDRLEGDGGEGGDALLLHQLEGGLDRAAPLGAAVLEHGHVQPLVGDEL